MAKSALTDKRSILTKIKRKPSVVTDFIKAKIIFSRKDQNEIRNFISQLKNDVAKESSANTSLPLCKVACIEDWENLEFRQTLMDLKGGKFPSYIHRKEWEWTMGIIAMKRLGKLHGNCKAVGIGAGKEDVLFYLSNKLEHVNATDLYQSEWEESPQDFVTNYGNYAPFEFRKKRLQVTKMDGTDLKFPDEVFDIAFSFSSIEHFGGDRHSGPLRSLKEMERVLKPGGIAVIATEYIINGKEHKEYFNKQNISDHLLNKLKMQLVEPLDLEISRRTLDTVLDFYAAVDWSSKDEGYKTTHPHIVLRTRNVLHTSFSMVFKKE